MKTTLHIKIFPNYQFQCIIKNQQQSQIIQLRENEQIYSSSILIENNKIQISPKESDKSNENFNDCFLKDIIEQPDELKTYKVNYQNENYDVIGEVLFAIMINEFKEIIEKKWIIQNTKIELENVKAKERLEIALRSINLKIFDEGNEKETNDNEEFDEDDFDLFEDDESFEMDESDKENLIYQEQGIFLHEILNKRNEYNKYQYLLNRAYKLTSSNETKQIIENMKKEIYDEKSYYHHIYQFGFNERNEMKMVQLDNYCLFIASRFFETINDHINFVKSCQKLKHNLEKFYYNPFPVDPITVEYFPNIQTLYCYEKENDYLLTCRIKKYLELFPRSLEEVNAIRRKYPLKQIEFKRCYLSSNDVINIIENYNIDDECMSTEEKHVVVCIPKEINEIQPNAFKLLEDQLKSIKEISITNTETIIPKNCLERCCFTTNISIPLNKTRIVIGNKIFTNDNQFNQLFLLPSSIKVINNIEVDELKSLTIPSNVTSIAEDCFSGFQNKLTEIVFPESLNSTQRSLFSETTNLQQITISEEYQLHGDELFKISNGCLYSIHLPSSLKRINGRWIELHSLETFTIPSNVTKLSDYCFEGCKNLTELKGLEHVKEFGSRCFNSKVKVNINELQLTENQKVKLLFDLNVNEMKLLEEWTGLHYDEILFDSTIDDWSIHTSIFNKRIIGKSKLLFLIEDDRKEKFGFYLNSEVVEEYDKWQKTDDKSFNFNLQSNGRLSSPMKFETKDSKRYFLEPEDYKYLITLGEFGLNKKEAKYYSRCYNSKLCGKNSDWPDYEYVNPIKFLVIQMM